MNDEQIITAVMKAEGWDKFTDRADDRGGPTKWGITLSTFRGVRGYDATVEQLKALDEEGARAIYREVFLVRTGIARIQDDVLRALIFDSAVQHGPGQAIRMLQRALGVVDDGVLGPLTLAALPHLNVVRLWNRMFAERLEFYGRLISKNLTDADKDGIPDNAEMAAGWMHRMGELLRARA
jgi:lysozyme family protein